MKYLFIGGSRDGEWISVDQVVADSGTPVMLPELMRHKRLVPESRLTFGVPVAAVEHYRQVRFLVDDDQVQVFYVLRELQGSPISHLLAGYRKP